MLNNSKRVERLVSVIFFFSGLSALVYQVVWQRLLTVHYGVGPISTALVVTVYMVGLGLGALFGGYLSERLSQRMLIYCFIELGIGVFGVVSPDFLGFLGKHTAGSNYALSFVYMFSFLSIPTFLMGMTLPLLTKIFNNIIDDFLGTISFLYFINTIGAAVGAIVASYVIISFFGLLNAVYFAAAINFTMSILIFLALKWAPPRVSRPETQTGSTVAPGLGPLAYPLVFVTGFLAIGYEIIWFRVIGLLAKDSPYAFSSVLSVYLVGIAVGSFGMKGFLERYKDIDKKSLFFVLQFVVGVTVGLSFIGYFYLTKYTPFGEITKYSFIHDLHPGWYKWRDGLEGGAIIQLLARLYSFLDVFISSALFVLIPTLLMGASFPLISFLALGKGKQEGKTVGLVYFFTIIGNALAGILTGLLILPRFGTEPTLAVLCAIGIAFGLGARKLGEARALPLGARLACVAVPLAVIALFFPSKGELYEAMHTPRVLHGESLFAETARPNFLLNEGIDGLIGTYQNEDHLVTFINGSAHGGRPGYSFYYETIEAMSRAPKLTNALVIGFGTGSLVETLLKSEEIKEVVLVELNRTLIANLRRLPLFDEMLSDPRLRLIIDDGRRYLLNSEEKFDLITTDPLRTTTAYSNNLYSENFFRLVDKHLNPGGIYLAWQDEHHVVPKTLAAVFPYIEMQRFFCVNSNAPLAVNESRRQRLIEQFPNNDQELILAEAGYLGDRSYVLDMSKNYPINRDWEPWSEYFIGLFLREKMGSFSQAR